MDSFSGKNVQEFKSFTPGNLPPEKSRSRRKRSKPGPPAIITRAKDIDIEKHFYFHPLHTWKASSGTTVKMVKISPMEFKSATTKVPVRLQLDGGGSVPFDVSIDPKFGGTSINFSLTNKEEAQSIQDLNEAFIKLAQKHKNLWWPKKKRITDGQIRDNFGQFVFEPKDKDDGSGEQYPPNIRTRVPISDTTGEPIPVRTRKGQKVCAIEDHDGAIISHHDLYHREWGKLIIDVYGIYFKDNFGWGVTKYVSKVKLAHDPEAEADYQEVEFVETDDGHQNKKARTCADEVQRHLDEVTDTQEFNFPQEVR